MITDSHLGRRLRCRRRILDLTQQDVADRLGVTFQTVQKYESGIVAMSAVRLAELARALDVSVTYFFDLPETGAPA